MFINNLKRIFLPEEENYEPQPFKLYKAQHTKPPIVVPYTYFGHGYIASVRDRATHYFRMRPFLGRSDPSLLYGGLQVRNRIARTIFENERREIERQLWTYLFAAPPTHVLRLGWKSLITNYCHDILYIPLSFRYPNYSDRSLAREWGQYTYEYLLKTESRALLCPASRSLLEVQLAWLTIPFVHHYWLLVEEPLRRQRELWK